jgi:hypothetical protein
VVLPLTLLVPSVPRNTLFPNPAHERGFCSGPVSADPMFGRPFVHDQGIRPPPPKPRALGRDTPSRCTSAPPASRATCAPGAPESDEPISREIHMSAIVLSAVLLNSYCVLYDLPLDIGASSGTGFLQSKRYRPVRELTSCWP